MYSIEWIEKWATALESDKYTQHIFDKNAICQPICMKYGDGKWNAIGVLVEEIFKPEWTPFYAPGEMPPIAGVEPWFSEMKKKAKIACFGCLGSAGPIPDKVLNSDKFWPSFYNHISTQNYYNVSFKELATAIRNYDPKEWEPKKR